MHAMALSLCLLLPLVQAFSSILSISADTGKYVPPYELDWVDPLTGEFTKIVDLAPDGNALNFSSALQHNKTFVYTKSFSSPISGCLTTVDLSTKQIQDGQRYPNIWFTNIAFDNVTNQTFVIGLNHTTNRNSLFEVLSSPSPALREMIVIPGEVLVATSTYSSSKHLFFVATQTGKPNVRNLIGVDTRGGGKVISNITIPLAFTALTYDDTFGVFYAWGYDSTGNVNLVSLDFASGNILKSFYNFTTPGASLSCINKEGTVDFSSWATSYTSIFALWLYHAEASSVPADRNVLTLNC